MIRLLLISFLTVAWSCTSINRDVNSKKGDISVWMTNGDMTSLFAESTSKLFFGENNDTLAVLEVDTTQRYQTVDGFGFALTGGSASLLNQKLTTDQRKRLLKELFLYDSNNIGISYLRISIGASDLDDHAFSYDDLPL